MKPEINRAKEDGFVKYMTDNPVYFEMLYKQKATIENVTTVFKEMKQAGLVAAPHVSDRCRCKLCKGHEIIKEEWV